VKHTARRSSYRAVALSLFVCLLGLAAFAASSEASVPSVPWNGAAPITWSLFQCTAPADAVHRSEAAAIHMTIRWHASYSLTSTGGDWTGHVGEVTVTNTMEPSLSWVVPGKATEQVLRHERLHFDLNEVFRRKLEIVLPCVQATHATKDSVIGTLNSTLQQRANEVLTQLQAAQSRYDAETRHGNDAAGQARWEAQIAAWLLNPAAAR